MGIITSIQESAEGWRMAFSSLLGGVMKNSAKFSGVMAPMQKTELGTALIGGGFSAAQQRYVGIKAGGVSVVSAEATAPVGVRYMPATPAPSPQPPPPVGEGARVGVPAAGGYDPGTPATVIETIQKSISESAEGWRMGFAHVAGKAKEVVGGAQKGIEKSLAGWQWGISEAGSKVSESFGNVGDFFKSAKYQMLIPVIILAFIAVMVAIGYSGLGAPAARVVEREHARRR